MRHGKARMIRWLAVAVMLAMIPGSSDPLSAQYARDPRFAKTPRRTPTYHRQPVQRIVPTPMAQEYDTDEPWPEQEEMEVQARAQQALLHNARSHGNITPIPSAYRVQHASRASGQTGEPAQMPSPPNTLSPNTMNRGQAMPMEPHAAPHQDSPAIDYQFRDDQFVADEWVDEGDSWDGGYGDHWCDLESYADQCGMGSCFDWCQSRFCRGNTEIFAGVTGFKGPANQGLDGSFGFQEGINFGTMFPLVPEWGVGWQVGVRTIQANIAGTSFTDDQRNQTFFTSGFFKRCPVGFNTGFVFDMLQDNWYSNINVGQVRAQFSWRFPERHEWGYWFAAGDSVDTTVSPLNPQLVDEWNPLELHAFFYRRRLCFAPGGTTSLFAGWTGGGDGLVGANAQLPICSGWSIKSSFTYLAPDESNSNGGNEHEAWNVSMLLVWTLGGHCETAFTPMFDVADNGSFIVSRNSR